MINNKNKYSIDKKLYQKMKISESMIVYKK